MEVDDAQKDESLAYGRFTFQGAYVYSIDAENGFKLRGKSLICLMKIIRNQVTTTIRKSMWRDSVYRRHFVYTFQRNG